MKAKSKFEAHQLHPLDLPWHARLALLLLLLLLIKFDRNVIHADEPVDHAHFMKHFQSFRNLRHNPNNYTIEYLKICVIKLSSNYEDFGAKSAKGFYYIAENTRCN